MHKCNYFIIITCILPKYLYGHHEFRNAQKGLYNLMRKRSLTHVVLLYITYRLPVKISNVFHSNVKIELPNIFGKISEVVFLD